MHAIYFKIVTKRFHLMYTVMHYSWIPKTEWEIHLYLNMFKLIFKFKCKLVSKISSDKCFETDMTKYLYVKRYTLRCENIYLNHELESKHYTVFAFINIIFLVFHTGI